MANAPHAAAIRVLLCEDSKDDVELVTLELARHGFDCAARAVETRPDFLDALANGPWDVVLSDHSMREFSSMEALALVRASDPDLPFIIVSGTIGEDAAVKAMKAGAQDYVLKQNLRRLGPAVEREMREAASRRRERQKLQASENQLRHAQKLEAVGRLAGGIAHDFNNLLTVILGFSEFLIEQLPVGTPGFRDASEIRVAAQRAGRLTKQLLAFSRQQVLEPRVVDLVAALNDLQPMIQRLIGEDIRCEFTLPPTPQLVLIDPGQFEQIMLNLVVNARDAMPEGGRLTLELSRTTVAGEQAAALDVADGDYITVTVTDTGEGMDAETVEHIFEPFFTTKDPGRGTGLGLSTVFGIVRQSHGGIEVRTAPKQGTTFRIYFVSSKATAADDDAVDATPRPLTAPSTILLVEDEQGVRSFLEAALQRAGHRVIATSSGQEAVSAAARSTESIDLVITDVVMPGMAGPEVARLVSQSHPRVSVLFLSGYSTHASLPDSLTADPSAFLQKPFSAEALLAKVQERLARP
jgi:two-component system cell cycle sensor histidine kinase/response regulator CckA